MNQTIFEQICNTTEELEEFSIKSLTETQLNNLESSLSKDLTPIQTKCAMNILHAFHEDVAAQDTEATVVCILFFEP